MREVHVVGSFRVPFGKHTDKDHKTLVAEAVRGLAADAGVPDLGSVEAAFFANCNMGLWGQGNIRGQVCLWPLVQEGFFPRNVPVVNVEGGCATGSLAFQGACKEVLSGQADFAVAIGVEKMWMPDPAAMTKQFDHGADQFDPSAWKAVFSGLAEAHKVPFAPVPERVVFLDVYALKAQLHMARHGTTTEQIAHVASKNHAMGAKNPKAQYRFTMTPEQVLADRVVCAPLTRAMCAPMTDGAAAVLVASERGLASLKAEPRERAVRVIGMALSGGAPRGPADPSLTRVAAKRAYAMADLAPKDIDVAEVHDATSWSEIHETEMLGFCEVGDGGPFAASGATSLGGSRPVNVSGGLISKGHPLGVTGLAMVDELCLQLRGEAGERQVTGARVGLAHNAGGLVGLDEAACSVVILKKTA